jgi:hypothetical protein
MIESVDEWQNRLFGGSSHIRVIVKEDIKSPCCDASMYILNYPSVSQDWGSAIIELGCSKCNKQY